MEPAHRVIAAWEDAEAGSERHLGTLRDVDDYRLTAAFHTSAVLNRGSPEHTLSLQLVFPRMDGDQTKSVCASVCCPADSLGPIATRSHPSTLGSKIPDPVLQELNGLPFNRGNCKELVIVVRHPPSVFFSNMPYYYYRYTAIMQRHMQIMHSLSRAKRVRLFFPNNSRLGLDDIVVRFNAVPVSKSPTHTSSRTYEADIQAKWRGWGVTVPAPTEGSAAPRIKRERPDDMVAEEQEERSDAEQQQGRSQKRVRLDCMPDDQTSDPFGRPAPSPNASTASHSTNFPGLVHDNPNPGATSLPPSANAEEAPTVIGQATFTQVRPTTDLANRWAEWWQFTYRSLGADRADTTIADLMRRTMQAVRNNDVAAFETGMVESAMYTLGVDDLKGWEVE